ncbi:hypothetical protein SAMN05428962_0933 [Paenibacillus sp. BC26]|nr:hypothetical protein SAMN05428962_0933 [Paenibacillus sp. BC26]
MTVSDGFLKYELPWGSLVSVSEGIVIENRELFNLKVTDVRKYIKCTLVLC